MHHRYIQIGWHSRAAGIRRPPPGRSSFRLKERLSVVTTRRDMLTSAPSSARLIAGASTVTRATARAATGGAAAKGRSGDSPMEILTRLPAVVALDRFPVPALAAARDGTILLVRRYCVSRDGRASAGQLSGVGVPGDLPYRPSRLVRPFWRRCTGESGCGAAALGGLDGAGQDEQIGVDASR
jgi:hypothetical protein